jgi:hypothetical protein
LTIEWDLYFDRIKAIVDQHQIPIITSGELRKKATGDIKKAPTVHDIMETSKLAYNFLIAFSLLSTTEVTSYPRLYSWFSISI